MKLAIAIAAALTLTACADGVLTTPNTAALVNPTEAYELDTWGANSELYEFTPRSNKSMTCVVFILDNTKAMSMQCFPKPLDVD